MEENKTLDMVKKAILLEHRGKALYESVAQKTKVAPVKELFEMLVEEEEKHIDILAFKRHYRPAIDARACGILERGRNSSADRVTMGKKHP